MAGRRCGQKLSGNPAPEPLPGFFLTSCFFLIRKPSMPSSHANQAEPVTLYRFRLFPRLLCRRTEKCFCHSACPPFTGTVPAICVTKHRQLKFSYVGRGIFHLLAVNQYLTIMKMHAKRVEMKNFSQGETPICRARYRKRLSS